LKHFASSRSTFILCSALGLLAGCGVGVTPEARVKRAEQLLGQGDYGAAMLELRNALQEKPDYAAAELTLAHASLLLNNPDAAARSIDQALLHGADRAAAALLRVQLLQQSGSYAELLKQLDANVLALSPLQRELARAQALAGLRRCPEAIRNARPLLHAPETEVMARIVLAECYAQAGHPQLALDLLQAAVKLQPDNAEAWLALGRVQQLSGQVVESEASWQKANEHAAGHLTALQQLTMATTTGDQQLSRGDFAAARATQQRMLRIAPQGGLTMLLDARLQMAEGKLEPAIAALQTLTHGSPDFDGARNALASALLAAGKHEQARAAIGQLAHDRPQARELGAATELLRKSAGADAEAAAQKEPYWLGNAAIQLLLGQPAMARQALERAAKIAPDSLRTSVSRVQLELRTGNGAAGLRLAQEMQAHHAGDPQALLLLAQAQRAQHDFAAAVATLEKLQALQPTPQTLALLYGVRRELDPSSALAALEDWIGKHPQDRVVLALYADGLMSAGRNADAIAAYEKILPAVAQSTSKPPAISAQDVVVLNNVAWLYYLEKDKRAVPTARRAYELAPRAANVADTYGWLLLESGANEEGLKVFMTLQEGGVLIEPDWRYHLAAALARNGNEAEAREQLALLLEESAQFPTREAAVALAEKVK